jgi:hypothetical protein
MIVTLVLFFVSIVIGPWWLTVIVGTVLLARWNAVIPVVVGGILMDMLFGVPLTLIGNTMALYTLAFSLMAFASLYLSATMIE